MQNMITRPGTQDDFVLHENGYAKCRFSNSDNWLDIGGNIGAFCVKYSSLVCRIYSFEPDEENFFILKTNVLQNDCMNVQIFNSAVVGNNEKQRTFYLNNKTNKGTHSFFVKRGRTPVWVDCVNINKVINDLRPNKIKIDCEGSEYEIITQIKSFSSIEEIIIEFHFNQLKDHPLHEKYKEVLSILQKNFTVVDAVPEERINKHWTTIIHAYK